MIGDQIKDLLRDKRISLQREKETQLELLRILTSNFSGKWHREFRLDEKNIVDFFLEDTGSAIEVKLTGSRREIYKQCERYCAFEKVRELILITNRAIGFPQTINGKDTYLINIGRAWL